MDVERAQRADEVAGDHEVVRFVDREAVRIESVRREESTGHAFTKCSPASYSTTRPGWAPFAPPMNVTRKPPLLERGELVGDGCLRRIVRADERRMARIGDVEEEDLILTTQHAEQATERQRPPVAGETDVVRLVADRAGVRTAVRYGGPCRRSGESRSKSMTARKSGAMCAWSDAQTSRVFSRAISAQPGSRPEQPGRDQSAYDTCTHWCAAMSFQSS